MHLNYDSVETFDLFFVEGYGKVMNETTMKKRIEELYMESKDLTGKSTVGSWLNAQNCKKPVHISQIL